jgi:hypothetical protein
MPIPPSRGTPAAMPRSLQVALFLTGFLWLLAAQATAMRAASGIAARLVWSSVGQQFLSNLFLVFLLAVGFAVLNWIGTRQGSLRLANALPRRVTAREEWSRGVIIGWSAALVAIIPTVILGALHPEFFWSRSSIAATLLSLLSLLLAALAVEVAFRGFLFRRLIDAIGPTAATILLSGVYALLGGLRPNASGLSFIVMFIGGVLFSIAYLRTHALWLGWGIHFAWLAALALVFGLPVAGDATYSGIVQSDVGGPQWLTGGAYGLEAALFTAFVFLVAMAAVYRVTRNYAWNYTHPVIVPAGYPMDVPPPPAHAEMEQQAAAKSPTLVQITPGPAAPNGSQSQSDSSEAAHHG